MSNCIINHKACNKVWIKWITIIKICITYTFIGQVQWLFDINKCRFSKEKEEKGENRLDLTCCTIHYMSQLTDVFVKVYIFLNVKFIKI